MIGWFRLGGKLCVGYESFSSKAVLEPVDVLVVLEPVDVLVVLELMDVSDSLLRRLSEWLCWSPFSRSVIRLGGSIRRN
jgi:hypothetical protein